MLIILSHNPLVPAAQGVNQDPLVQLGLDQHHPDQLKGHNESATQSPVHRTR